MILLTLAAALADAPVHDPPGSFLRDRHWDVRHLDLALTVDPEAGTVSGTATHAVTPLGRRSAWMQLDQVGLDISAITVDGQAIEDWSQTEELLRVPMPDEGLSHEVAITYTAQPENGLHFRGPARGDNAIEVFSQGEDDDNRYWYPGWDFPSDKFTVSTRLTVPNGLTALAVGELQSKEDAERGWTTWAYALEQPITNYLVTIAVGEYRERQVSPTNIVYSPKGMNADDAARSLGIVSEMIPWVVEWTGGVDYPYPLYRQVVTQEFLYGAMENPTLVTFNNRYVLEDDDPRPWGSENVVMHELAHQWFGNLVTTYGWADLWLNEGFATLLAMDWMAQQHGAGYAAEDAWSTRRSALRDTRPMAALPHTRSGTTEHTDQYVQGSTALRWLRHYIGRDAFHAGVHRYLMRHSSEYASSEDLRRALEETGGRDLTWFFDQFVHGEGHPTVSASWEHTESTLTVTLSTEDAWDLPVDIVVNTSDGPITRTVWVSDESAQLTMDMPTPPSWVVLDPQALTLATIELDQPASAWAAALAHDDPWIQMAALSAIDDETGSAVVEPLIDLATSDRHVKLREVAVRRLGSLGTDQAVAALLTMVDDDEAVIREAAVDGLGEVRSSERIIARLLRSATLDPDERTAASAMVAMVDHDEERALALARTAVRTSDLWGAAFGAEILGDEGTEADVPRLLARLDAEEDRWVRSYAMSAAIAIAKRKESSSLTDQVRDAITALLSDRDVVLRRTAIRALGSMEGSGPVLRAYANETTSPSLAAAAHAAATRSAELASGTDAEADEPEGDEEDALETLQDRLDTLSERIERLERWR